MGGKLHTFSTLAKRMLHILQCALFVHDWSKFSSNVHRIIQWGGENASNFANLLLNSDQEPRPAIYYARKMLSIPKRITAQFVIIACQEQNIKGRTVLLVHDLKEMYMYSIFLLDTLWFLSIPFRQDRPRRQLGTYNQCKILLLPCWLKWWVTWIFSSLWNNFIGLPVCLWLNWRWR